MSPIRSLTQVNWSTWTPGVRATLVFVFKGSRVLLIHKKTGLGKGKINAPGGKLEMGETAEECARREVEEEVGIAVGNLDMVAELRFLMSDYPDILCHVFFSKSFEGIATESFEAKPFWCEIEEIPYEQMWSDDAIWLPKALNGDRVLGLFEFHGERMLGHQVFLMDEAPSRTNL